VRCGGDLRLARPGAAWRGGVSEQQAGHLRWHRDQKYFDEFTKKDLHFFLGTTQQFHFIAPNPWVIIGVLPIPSESPQLGLF